MEFTIRDACESDFPAITSIYNDIILTSTAVYRDVPTTVDERLEWWRGRQTRGYATLVACGGSEVEGFASFGDFRASPGYRFTVEHTVHVASAARGHGVGSALMRQLIQRAAALGKHLMIGAVDAENQASLQFHERLGFEQVALLREVGFKFGRFLNLALVQRSLDSRGEPGQRS